MNSPQTTVRASTPITYAEALDCRARALSYAIRCFEEKKKAAPTSRPDDTERSENACAKDEYTG